ncbi:uncharacterized protein LOC143290610 isoform X2 [Babylonia areolata]|uniref:uncharacterized protein LOC143290610 isoform X2 n=1 Tax=Babylonia areolata TaxID=304850 RepID=UPI003FD1B711
MATAEDDDIEILSCHIEHEADDVRADQRAAIMVKMADRVGEEEGEEDPGSRQRKRVARAVGVVTFILLLFSVLLIGVSLNMSKNIDEMVRQANEKMRHEFDEKQTRLKNNMTLSSRQVPL